MQVTRHNFALLLSEFKRDLAKCDFVAMDQEMCGIQRPGKEVLRSMTPVEAWVAPFFAARTYVAFQCGLCLCRIRRDGTSAAASSAKDNKDDDAPPTPTAIPAPLSNAAAAAAIAAVVAGTSTSASAPGGAAPSEGATGGKKAGAAATSIPLAGSTHRLEVKPYNFWLRQHGRSAPDVQLNMDAIDFLSRNGMDFNAWLNDGMEYCGAVTAEGIRARVLPRAYPAGANEVALKFAKFVKAIIVDQWYRGLPVDLSLTFADYCAATADAGGSPSGAALAASGKKAKKNAAKAEGTGAAPAAEGSGGGAAAAAAAATSADAATATAAMTCRTVAIRRILAGCSSLDPTCGGGSASAKPASPSSAAQLGKQTSITSSGMVGPPPSSASGGIGRSESPAPPPPLLTSAHSDAFVGSEPQRVLLVTASPDGTLVAGATAEGTVKVWNVLSMRHVATLRVQGHNELTCTSPKQQQQSRSKHHHHHRDAASPSGFASSASAGSGTFAGECFSFTTLSFHPNSAFLAGGTTTGYVALWDISTAAQVQHFSLRSVASCGGAASDRGRNSASLKRERTATLGIAALKFDSRGLNLAVATAGGQLAVWDVLRAAYVAPPRRCSFWDDDGGAADGDATRDNRGRASGDDVEDADDLESNESGESSAAGGDDDDAAANVGATYGTSSPVVSFLQYSDEGGVLLLGFVNDRRVRAYAAATLEPLPSFFLPRELLLTGRRKSCCAASGATGEDKYFGAAGSAGGVAEATVASSFVTMVAPSGRVCAAPNMPAPRRLRDSPLGSGKPSRRSSQDRDAAAAASPSDESSGGSCSDDDNEASAVAAAAAAGASRAPSAAALAAQFAIALCECQVALTLSKQELKDRQRQAAAATAQQQLQQKQQGPLPRFFVGHTAPVTSLEFSADSKKLLSGSLFDGTVRIWDVEALFAVVPAAPAASADAYPPPSAFVVHRTPLIVLQQGPRVLATPVLRSLVAALCAQSRTLGRSDLLPSRYSSPSASPPTSPRAAQDQQQQQQQQGQQQFDDVEAFVRDLSTGAFNNAVPGADCNALLFRAGSGAGGGGTVCFTGRQSAVATCTGTDANVSVWETAQYVQPQQQPPHQQQQQQQQQQGQSGGAYAPGVVSISLECVTVALPERAGSELPAMLQTDLMLGKCDVELERRHVGGRYVFRRRAAGYHDQLLRRRQDELTEKLGFRLFFEALKDAKKPLVGHHFTSDLAFFINQHECGIKEDYAWFKRTVHSIFPSVYDTKAIAARVGASHLNLEDLFNRRQNSRFTVEMNLPMAFLSYHPNGAGGSGGRSGGSSSSSQLQFQHTSHGASRMAVAHQGAYDAMMTGVVFWSFVQEDPNLLTVMENAISFFGINYWMNLDSNFDFLAWCQVIMVEHPGGEHFQSEAHIREFLDGACPGAVEEVPGAFVQFVKQGPSFNIVVRPHASGARIEQLCQKLQRAGFNRPRQWAGKVSSVSLSAAQAQAASASATADPAVLLVLESSTGPGGASQQQQQQQQKLLTKKQRRELAKLQSARDAQQQMQMQQQQQQQQHLQRSRGNSFNSRRGADSCASSQIDDGDREDSGE